VIEKESGLSAKLHPLVIMSISDHFTRYRVQSNNSRVVGALMGEQKGRVVDIAGSFELIVGDVDRRLVLDQQFLLSKVENYKKVFPSEEFLGWYTVSSKIDAAQDAHLHNQFLQVNENPLWLVLDAVAARAPAQKELPITLFESEVRIVQDAPAVLFNKLAYVIETNEAERIAVDHVAHLSTAGHAGEGSQTTAHLSSLHNAVLMLRERLVLLETFIGAQQAAVAAGQPLDLASLRRIGALTRSLPALSTDRFKDEFLVSFNDTALLTYLAAITKTVDGANALVETFNVTAESKAHRRGLRLHM